VVHGWVYGLHNGLLKDLSMTVSGPSEVEPAYATALAGIHARYA
jgi:carbonic anhydrase